MEPSGREATMTKKSITIVTRSNILLFSLSLSLHSINFQGLLTHIHCGFSPHVIVSVISTLYTYASYIVIFVNASHLLMCVVQIIIMPFIIIVIPIILQYLYIHLFVYIYMLMLMVDNILALK